MLIKTISSLFVSMFFVIFDLYAADFIHPNSGTAAFPFLEAGYDARAIAMGDASAGMFNELYGIVGNPAALARIERRQIYIGFRPIILDIMGTPVAFAFPFRNTAGREVGVLVLSGIYLSQGSVREIDAMGVETGAVWHASSLSGGISWAMILWENIFAGATIKAVYDHISSKTKSYSAKGIAFDLGAQYHINSNLAIGIVTRNVGAVVARYTPTNSDMAMPLVAIIGLCYRLQHIPQLRFAFDLSKGYDRFLSGHLGAEFDVYKDFFTIRVGYSASRPDVQEALRVLAGNASETYAKSEWSALRFGVGFNTFLGAVGTRLDAAYQMRAENIEPAFILSVIISF